MGIAHVLDLLISICDAGNCHATLTKTVADVLSDDVIDRIASIPCPLGANN